MREITEFVKKKCKPGVSYAMTENGPDGLLAGAFVTHSWDGNFEEFVESLRQAFRCFPEKPNLWICSFALPQDEDALKNLLNAKTPLEDMPFIKALDAAERFVVVRNSNKDLYSRIWCVCELMYALKKNKLRHTLITGPDTWSHLDTNCENAVASHPGDRDRIRAKLIATHNSLEVVDEQIQRFRNFPSVYTRQVGTETAITVQEASDETNPDESDASESHSESDLLHRKVPNSNEDDNWLRWSHFPLCFRSFRPGYLRFLLIAVGGIATIAYLFSGGSKPPCSDPECTGEICSRTSLPLPHESFLPLYTKQTICNDDSSPQADALVWLKDHPEYRNMSETRKSQLFSLATFCFSTGGPSEPDVYNGNQWKSPKEICQGWLSRDKHECKWDGIKCTETESLVQIIDMENRVLRGTIPPEISMLQNLTALVLRVNFLVGSIPSQLGDMTALTNLDLDANPGMGGTIPTELAKLTLLESLLLRNIGGVGSIPTEIGLLTNLKYVALDENKFRSTIPTELGKLINLEQFFMRQSTGGKLSGTIPTELGLMSNILSISLGWNDLKGTLPTEFGNLRKLERLWLDGNPLSGVVPEEWTELASHLQVLWLNAACLSTPVPAEFQNIPDLKLPDGDKQCNE